MKQETLNLTNIKNKSNLPKIGDFINTKHFNFFNICSVKILTKPRKYPDLDDIYLCWVDCDGDLERLVIDFNEEPENCHGVGGNWQDEVLYDTVKKQAKKFNLNILY